jgi:hypothetical protein
MGGGPQLAGQTSFGTAGEAIVVPLPTWRQSCPPNRHPAGHGQEQLC